MTIVLTVLKKYASDASPVELILRTQAGEIVVTGKILEVQENALVLEASDGIHYITSEDITRFRILKNTVDCKDSIDNTKILSSPDTLSSPESSTSPSPELLIPNPPDIPEGVWLKQFSEMPHLDPIEPNFAILDLNKEDQQELNRWKNRYDYALKVRELDRIMNDIPSIERLGQRTQNPALFRLAAALAFKAGEFEEAKLLLRDSIALGDIESDQLAAILCLKDSNYIEAAENICRALEKILDSKLGEPDELAILLGRIIKQSESSEMPGIGLLCQKLKQNGYEVIASQLLFLALSGAHPDAAAKALSLDFAAAQKAAPSSTVFAKLPAPIEPETLQEELPQPVMTQARFGHITAYYPNKDFGFLTDDLSQKTYFFHVSRLSDLDLYEELSDGRVGQRVSFREGLRMSRDAKYDPAEDLRAFNFSAEREAEASVATNNFGLKQSFPKGAGSYSQAKIAEKKNDLDLAKKLFQDEIRKQGDNWLSAVMDLATLHNRLTEVDAAIKLLRQYRSKFEDVRPVDNQIAHFMMHNRRYEEASQFFAELKQKATGRTRETLIRQEASCLFALGRYEEATKLLNAILEHRPSDMATIKLLEKITSAAKAANAGKPEQGVGAVQLEEFSSGISLFGKFAIQNCDLRGIDERSKARGFFDQKDFHNVERRLEDLKKAGGRLPKEKADYFLSLASMVQKNPEFTEDRTTADCLRGYFSYMGEAALHDNLHVDASRSYLVEALYYATADTAESTLVLLLSTYLTERCMPGELLRPMTGRLQTLLSRFENDLDGFNRFLNDFPYYSTMSAAATKNLVDNVQKVSKLKSICPSEKNIKGLREKEVERLNSELSTLGALTSQASTANAFQTIASVLKDCSESTRFDLDKQRLRALSGIALETAAYWMGGDFNEREAKQARLLNSLNQLISKIIESPTKLSIEATLQICRHLHHEISQNFQDYLKQSKPNLTLSNVLESDYDNVALDGSMILSIEVASQPGGAPIEGLDLEILSENGLSSEGAVPSPEVLRGGDRRVIQVSIRPGASQIADGAFDVSAILRYRTRSGEALTSPTYKLPVRVSSSEDFQQIDNPYLAYSGGKIVEDPKMFFGRQDLVQSIRKEITTGPLGQCFLLYGQKRSGKSSILKQLERTIPEPCLPVCVTLGMLDASTADTSFVQMCVDALHDKLVDDYDLSLEDWPSTLDVKNAPLAAFRNSVKRATSALRRINWAHPRLIFLIDEFTYVFEYIKEGIVPAQFMRSWKALLELETFSAVLVGQDSMPKFRREFPNEFGVANEQRISYLSPDDAKLLAEQPILLEGKTRYRGKSLSRLVELTAGSPFYLQISCDRLVRYLNRRKAAFITEADVNEVARNLVLGEDSLTVESFDPLITAAGESVAEASRHIYLQLLTSIANLSNQLGGARPADLPPYDNRERLLHDMKERDVIALDAAGRITIRVGLFAEWLRMNHHLLQKPAELTIS